MPITLVITTYNRPREVVDAINSAVEVNSISQIIVVDDGSIEPVRLRPDHRLTYFRHDECKGVSSARNTGLSLTTTPYIAYLDDDDTLCNDAFSAHLELFNRLPDHDAINSVVVGAVLVEKSGEITQRRIPPSTRPGEIWGLDQYLLQDNAFSFLTKQAALYPTRLLRMVGGWDKNIRSRVVTDLFIRISQTYPIYGIEDDTYILNRDDKNRITCDIGLRKESFSYLIKKHKDLLSSKGRFNYFLQNHRRKLYDAGEMPKLFLTE